MTSASGVMVGAELFLGSYAAPAGETCQRCRTVLADGTECWRDQWFGILCVPCVPLAVAGVPCRTEASHGLVGILWSA